MSHSRYTPLAERWEGWELALICKSGDLLWLRASISSTGRGVLVCGLSLPHG